MPAGRVVEYLKDDRWRQAGRGFELLKGEESGQKRATTQCCSKCCHPGRVGNPGVREIAQKRVDGAHTGFHNSSRNCTMRFAVAMVGT